MYITHDHLYRVGGASLARAGDRLLDGGIAVATSVGLGATVGYRHQKGVDPDKTMPKLGPIPLDIGLGVAGHLTSLFAGNAGGGWVGRIGANMGTGAFSFFGASAGQELGKRIAQKMSSSGGAGATPPGAMSGGGYRDAFGRFIEGGKQNPGLPMGNIPAVADVPKPETVATK